ncbi:MAG: hypothetical protein LLG04_14250 [Parachlamydia sp.]|nr:hypothetical protein [Parachlamydia sp.]
MDRVDQLNKMLSLYIEQPETKSDQSLIHEFTTHFNETVTYGITEKKRK